MVQVVLFLNPSQVNSAVQDSLTPEAMEESVRILDYKTIKGIYSDPNIHSNNTGMSIISVFRGLAVLRRHL
jgi:hypothetical protein